MAARRESKHMERRSRKIVSEEKEPEISRILQTYGDMLYRTAYLLLGNPHDVQDALQETLLRYLEKAPAFVSMEHEKAWLLRVTANCCKDFLRFQKRRAHLDIEEWKERLPAPKEQRLMLELYALPVKWKTALILHYFEGYSVRETGQILGISEAAAKKRLQRAREALKSELSS